MEFLPEVEIGTTKFRLLDVQRSGKTAIYKSANEYLRIGEAEKISRDLATHKRMEEFGFPVAQLHGEGELHSTPYFIEESLGDECFGLIFAREYESAGVISDDSWQEFLAICEQFASAQLKTVRAEPAWAEFEAGIHLAMALSEEPAHAKLFTDAFAETKRRLSVFPFAISHGDLTPFNIYPKGVIDLEDSFLAPAGFDLGALAEHLEWFPRTSNDTLHQLYTFTDSQKTEYYSRIDRLFMDAGLPMPSQYARELSYAKGVWFAVRLQKHPELMEFRYKHLIECANNLLAPPYRKP